MSVPLSDASPDATSGDVREWIARARRRLLCICAVYGASAALTLVALIRVLGWPFSVFVSSPNGDTASTAIMVAVATLSALGGAALAILATPRSRAAIARRVERAAPLCRNLVVTAEELLRAPDRVQSSVYALVQREAARTLASINMASLFPARRAALAGAAALALLVLPAVVRSRVRIGSPRDLSQASTMAALRSVAIHVIPPQYTALPPVTERDPSRIAVVAGSRVQVTVVADANDVAMETARGTTLLGRRGDSADGFYGEFVADADGFVALEPRARTTSAAAVPIDSSSIGARRLIGLSVLPDGAPRVHVTAPGHDVRLERAIGTLSLRLDADDDFGLATLKLRYTKVSGSGERFTFTDGEVPLSVTRRDARSWLATGTLNIPALSLEAGDMVVYRAVATDRRPGATPVESDSYIVEIAALGAIAAPGFAIDNDQSRYALSQQMVILKTQRLLDRRATVSAESFAADALELASEQRRVRAEFVFMMGGELADEVTSESSVSDLNETVEAEAEGDLAAGRMANQGRVALLRAVRHMSRASTALTSTLVPDALVDEKRALVEIERAFSRTRIILRALTEHERLDMSRRLSGNLSAVARDVRAPFIPPRDDFDVSVRGVLSDLSGLVNRVTNTGDTPARLTRAAQRMLQLDASSVPLQELATQLTSASTAFLRGDRTSSFALIDRASVGITMMLRGSTMPPMTRASSLESRRLAGRLRDARVGPALVPVPD